MSEKDKMVVGAAQADTRSIEQAESYMFAIRELMHTVLELKAMGIDPNARRDALGETLLGQLTYHYSEEQAFLWAEEFLVQLKRLYDAAEALLPAPHPKPTVSGHFFDCRVRTTDLCKLLGPL